MNSESILQAIVGGAPLRNAPSVQALYAGLKAHLLAFCGEDATLNNALLAYENNPAAARLDALRQAFAVLPPPADVDLLEAAQAVLVAVAAQDALGNKTTATPSPERPGEILCDHCGQPQPESRLVCWSCGREFISQAEAAALLASTRDPGKTIRLAPLPSAAAVGAAAALDDPATPAEDRLLPELLQTLKKINAEQEALRKFVETQNGTLRQLVGLQNMAHPVIVQDLRMDFGSMVVFMIKWAIAAIPAFLLLAILLSILMSIFGGIFLSAMLR